MPYSPVAGSGIGDDAAPVGAEAGLTEGAAVVFTAVVTGVSDFVVAAVVKVLPDDAGDAGAADDEAAGEAAGAVVDDVVELAVDVVADVIVL